MSSSVVSRNNVLAGVFVISSLMLAVTIAFILGDVMDQFGKKREYTVRFPTSVGVAGLQPGATVSFAGLPVGAVVAIEPHSSTPGAPADAMDVRIALDDRITLHENAFADLSPPLLGGVSKINFPSAGTGPIGPDDKLASLAENNANGVLDEGEAVRGRFAPSILAQLGFTVEDAEKIQAAIDDVEVIAENVKATSVRIDRIATDMEPKINAAVSDARAAVGDVKAFTGRLTATDGWVPRIDRIMANADDAAARAPALISDIQSAVASGRSMLENHTASIGRILGHAELVSERVRFETMDQAEGMLREGTLALADTRGLIGNIDEAVTDARPELGTTLANVRGLTAKAKMIMDEFRAQPWRFIKGQPSKEDLEREPIYAAARAYAEAVADLRAASEALDAAVQGRGPDRGTPTSPDRIAAVAQSVQSAYDRYADAERALLETLRQGTP
jgi:ABC-type transporter Mla subunit MlaD